MDDGSEGTRCKVSLLVSGQALSSEGEGNGPIEAFVHAVERAINERFAVDHYHEQSESSGSGASTAHRRPEGQRRRPYLGRGQQP